MQYFDTADLLKKLERVAVALEIQNLLAERSVKASERMLELSEEAMRERAEQRALTEKMLLRGEMN